MNVLDKTENKEAIKFIEIKWEGPLSLQSVLDKSDNDDFGGILQKSVKLTTQGRFKLTMFG